MLQALLAHGGAFSNLHQVNEMTEGANGLKIMVHERMHILFFALANWLAEVQCEHMYALHYSLFNLFWPADQLKPCKRV